MVAGVEYRDNVQVTVGDAVAVVNWLEPAEAAVDDEDLILRVHGSGFDPATEIVFDGGNEPTTFVSTTIVETTVRPSTASGTESVPVAVQTGDVLSNSVGFSFLGGAPAATSAPQAGVAETVDGAPVPEEPEAYDPGAHTVDEVLAYADEHPDEVDQIIRAEEAGKHRSTLLDQL